MSTELVRLCTACIGEGDLQWCCGVIAEGIPCARCGDPQGWHVFYPAVDYPRRVSGIQEHACSTSIALEVWPAIIWDPNGYYFALGVSPRATRREIRQAYEAKEGWNDPRLTYIFKQLLDPDIRRRYDATPLGCVFYDYDIETMRRRAISKRTANEIQEGIATQDEDGTYSSILDNEISRRENRATNSDRPSWTWDYFVWGTPSRDTPLLERWQAALCRSAARRGEVIRLSVGLAQTTICRTVGRDVVAFLGHHTEPTDQLADRTIDHFIRLDRSFKPHKPIA